MVNPRELIQEGGCDITSNDPREGLKCGCHSSQSEFKGSLVGPCELTKLNGKIFATGNLTNSIIELDPNTGESVHHNLPTSRAVPMGLTKSNNQFNRRSQKLWFTEFLSGKIGRFNPNTKKFKEFDLIPSGIRSGPVAIDVDNNGIVWFTAMFGNYLGKIENEEITKIDLPATQGIIGPRGLDTLHDKVIIASNGSNKLISINKDTGQLHQSLTFDVNSGNPIDVHVNENTQLAYVTLGLGDAIAQVNIENMEIIDIFSLDIGSRPSRLDQDSSGNVWVTQIIDNQIAQFNPNNNDIQEHESPLPLSSPEGIYIDNNDNVIFVMWAADGIAIFNQNTQNFQTFHIEGFPNIIISQNVASVVDDQFAQNRNKISQLIRRPFITPELNITDRISTSDIEKGINAIQEGIRIYAETGNDRKAVTTLINNLPEQREVSENQRVIIGYSGWINILNIIITYGIIATIIRWFKLIITIIQGWIHHELDP